MITVSQSNITPAKGFHSWVEYVECEKTDKCPLYADGKCACYRYIIGKNITCPNGKWFYEEGPTIRAKSISKFREKVRINYKPTAKEFKSKIAVVADYVFIPIAFLSGGRTEFEDAINGHFIKQDEFNEDMVERIVQFAPLTWFETSIIKDYKEKELPKFIQQLKEEMPIIYSKWETKYPDTAANYKELSPVGRTAYIKTLPDGCEISDRNGIFIKEKEYLVCDNWKSPFIPFKSKEASIKIYITDDMTIEVTEKMIVDSDTKYVD